jgi:hypothetical protein
MKNVHNLHIKGSKLNFAFKERMNSLWMEYAHSSRLVIRNAINVDEYFAQTF